MNRFLLPILMCFVAGCVLQTETLQGVEGTQGPVGPQGSAGPPGIPPPPQFQKSGSDIYYLDGHVGIGMIPDFHQLQVADRVGIRSESGEARLDLVGSSGLGPLAGYSTTLYMYDSAATTKNQEIAYLRAGLVNDLDTGNLELFTKKAEDWISAIYMENGRVGIGTTKPLANLHVLATTPGVPAVLFEASDFDPFAFRQLYSGFGGGATILSVDSAAPAINSGWSFLRLRSSFDGTSGTTQFSVDSSGNVLANGAMSVGGNLTVAGVCQANCPSDLRLKHSVSPITHSLDRLLRLRGVTYLWNDNRAGGREQTGLIAQDVGLAFPEWLGENETGSKTLNVPPLSSLALTIESLRELKEGNDALRVENSALAARLDAIEAGATRTSADMDSEPQWHYFALVFATFGATVLWQRRRTSNSTTLGTPC